MQNTAEIDPSAKDPRWQHKAGGGAWAGGLMWCLGETVMDVVGTIPELALLDKCESQDIKMGFLTGRFI